MSAEGGLVSSPVVKGLGLKRTLVMAALVAVVLTFAFDGFPHKHVGGLDDRECPACQAARQHVGDTPRFTGALLISPVARRPQPAEPAIERISTPPPVASSSPRSPPAVSA
jgi:hypothetical protein